MPIFLAACAQVVSPTGGQRDIVGPTPIKFEPPNQTTNFNEKKIKIKFSEFITLKDVQGQLLVSPPLKFPPELTPKGKWLIIAMEDTLKANTTYSFQFGNCVADITEGNASSNLKYVFSTGNLIDSLGLTGKLLNCKDNSPEKDFLVMLYDSLKFKKDSFVNKTLPDYFSKTDANGQYSISNIKEGSYKIFALKDANSNYKFDLSDEKIGFIDTIVSIKNKNNSLDLNSFLSEPWVQYIKKTNLNDFQKVECIFNKPIQKLELIFLNQKVMGDDYSLELGKNKDTLTVWFNKFFKSDSLVFSISDNGKTLDTIYYKVKKPSDLQKNRGRGKAKPFNLIVKSEAFNFYDSTGFVFSSTYPVKEIDSLKIRVISNKLDVNPQIKILDKSRRKFSLVYPWQEDTTYMVKFDSMAFKAYSKDLIQDSLSIKFNIPVKAKGGNFKLKVILPKNNANAILQLKDSKDILVKEVNVSETSEINFGLLKTGTYKVQMIVDENKNSKWDTGNYYLNMQPEKIILCPISINIRANWESEETWDPFKINEPKKQKK